MHSGMVSKLFSLKKSISSDDSTSRQVGKEVNPLLFKSSNFKWVNRPHRSAVWRVSFQTGLDERSSSVESALSSSKVDVSGIVDSTTLA